MTVATEKLSLHSDYIDIETEMGGALTPHYIQQAPMPLTSIALIDVTTKQKICLVVDPSGQIKEINQDGKHIIPCKNEKELIGKFLSKFVFNLST